MAQGDNADSKWDEKKMEEGDSVRTVDCLRGRLLAERLASRNAKEEAEQLGSKLMELENQLKQEEKSRKRAAKKLKLLFKKLESMNISDGSEYSTLVDKSDISSLSSATTSSLGTQESNQDGKSEHGSQNLHRKSELRNFLFGASDDNSSTVEGSSSSGFEPVLPDFKGQECEIGENGNPRSGKVSEDIEQNVAQNSTVENFLFSEDGGNSEKSSYLGSEQYFDASKVDDQSEICYDTFRFSTEDDLGKDDDQDNAQIDNSLALVVVDTPQKNQTTDVPQKNQTVDPEVLDATVRDVLDALRHAKEQLQSSMDKRRVNMIRVG